MSAIVGFLRLDGRPARAEELKRMVDILAHRGPDGRAIWVEGSVGLGQCMLHTTPESLNEHFKARTFYIEVNRLPPASVL